MSELTAALVKDVIAACQQGAADIASALGGAFDCEFTLGAAGQAKYSAEAPLAEFDGPGLLVLLTCGDAGLAIALPESSGLLPAWIQTPTADADSKLSTLAQELETRVLPATLAADKFEARRVASIQDVLTSAGASSDAVLVAMDATSGDLAGRLSLVWPLATPAAAFTTGAAAASASASTASASHANATQSRGSARPAGKVSSLGDLPHYARTLLKIRIPVSVQLASKQEKVREVVELVPGAIVKFDKGCDELLQMVIGGQPIAEGEAVKIGDKFGFRVTGLLAPREHFIPVRRPRGSK